MTKDKALEELFLAQKPMFDDQDAFMQKLERRLEAVEFIKQHEEANLRRYKYAMIATFVMGLLSGSALFAFVLTTPTYIPLLTFNASSEGLSFIQQNLRPIVLCGLMLFISYGIISIANNIIDISKTIKTFRPSLQA